MSSNYIYQNSLEMSILSNIIFRPEYRQTVLPFLQEEYFAQDPAFKVTYRLIAAHFHKYSQPPTIDTLLIDLPDCRGISDFEVGEARNFIQAMQKNDKDFDWLIAKTEKWCEDKHLYCALQEAIKTQGKMDARFQMQQCFVGEKISFTADKSSKRDDTFSAKDIQNMTFEPIKFVIPGFITEGLTLFCGKPKIGKSWLLLHAASALARGTNTLGDVACERGDVLYCALEDNKRRLQSRMQKLFPFDGWPERLDFKCSMPRLAEGGMKVVEDWITKANKPRLVIIDTLARVKMPTRRNQTPYEADYESIQGLQNLAGIYGIAIVVVHHLRKAESDDPFDTVSGTLGLTGAADSIMIIRREPQGVALMVQGRDVEECNKAVSFDRETSRWRIIGDADEIHQSNERANILATLRSAEAPLSPNQIATATGAKAANIRKLVAKMVDVGSVKKSQRGRYELAE